MGCCVTIQSLYRDKRTILLRACHDTIDCIVIGGQRLGRWLCHDTDATWPGEALRHGAGSVRGRARERAHGNTTAQACDTAELGLRYG